MSNKQQLGNTNASVVTDQETLEVIIIGGIKQDLISATSLAAKMKPSAAY